MGERPPVDLLASGSDREPVGVWRRLPVRGWVVLALGAVVASGIVLVATGAGRSPVVPPPALAALGPAAARVDDGGLLVRVEAPLRSREPVLLRSGTVTGGGLVVLVDPVPMPEPGAPEAVTAQVLAVVEPGCSDPAFPRLRTAPELQVVVTPQAGGAAVVLTSAVPARALEAAVTAACTPVRASVALPSGSEPAARALEVTVRLVDSSLPVQVLRLTGRGLALEVEGAGLEGPLPLGPTARPVTTSTLPVVVTDCSVEVLAPRRLALEVQRGDERLTVPVDAGPGVVAGLDELVRQTCRRERG